MIGSHIKKYLRIISYVFTSIGIVFVASSLVQNLKNKKAEYQTAIPPLVTNAIADVPTDGDAGGHDDCGH